MLVLSALKYVWLYVYDRAYGISFIYSKNNKGPNVDLWETAGSCDYSGKQIVQWKIFLNDRNITCFTELSRYSINPCLSGGWFKTSTKTDFDLVVRNTK